MSLRSTFTFLAFCALTSASLSAAQIKGKVTAVNGSDVTVQVKASESAAKDDKVTVFFKIPGGNDEIVVGSGKVTSAEKGIVHAKIDKLNGKLAVGQLGRITSAKGAKGVGAIAGKSPPTKQATATASPNDKAYTPPVGSPERVAIMKALRKDFYSSPELAESNPNQIKLQPDHLKVHGDWACIYIKPTKNGQPYAEARWVLLRRRDGSWLNLKYVDALRPFASESEAQSAIEMSAATIERIRKRFPGAPLDIFPLHH